MLTIPLPDTTATLRLGKALAHVAGHSGLSLLLLKGDLGAGKTTLVRGLVSCLPGGNIAEIASPSFTICNIYSTEPPVHHFDLYRLEPCTLDESLEESIDDSAVLTIIEWSERLPDGPLPSLTLIVSLTATPKGTITDGTATEVTARTATCTVPTREAQELLTLLETGWHNAAHSNLEIGA